MIDADAQRLLVQGIDAEEIAGEQMDTAHAGPQIDAALPAQCQPATRVELFKKFRGLAINECPFANLPETKSGRWGQGLTKDKMDECVWLQPVLVADVEFLEWTGENHLRHTRFVSLRDDKPARQVHRE